MAFRKELVEQALLHNSVGLVFHALPPFVAHDVLLIREIRLIQLVRQISHAVRLEPKCQFQLIRGKRLKIIGAVEIGGSIDVAGPCPFQVVKVRTPGHMPRAFKHHMLEKMRKTRAPRKLVRWANVVPQIDGNHRQAVIF